LSRSPHGILGKLTFEGRLEAHPISVLGIPDQLGGNIVFDVVVLEPDFAVFNAPILILRNSRSS
jgi:hypothetical protein